MCPAAWCCERPSVNIVLLLETTGLFNNVWRVWFLWIMSFRDPCLSPPCLPIRATQVRVEAGFSKQSLPVALSPSPLSSCHSPPLPEPCCSSDLTSSAISCLQLEPRWIYHRWCTCTKSLCKNSTQLGRYFFFFWSWVSDEKNRQRPIWKSV